VRHLDEPSFLGKLAEVRIDAHVDALSTSAGSTGEVMVMVSAMGEAVHLSPVLAHTTLHGAGPFKRFETSVNSNYVTSLGIQSLEGFLGGKGTLGLGENAKNGSPLLGDSQTRFSQSGYGLIEKMRLGALGHESNLTNWNGCEKGNMGCMDGS
jgi:hypothetical protein